MDKGEKMKATGSRFIATILIVLALGLAVFAGSEFASGRDGSVGFGVFVLFMAGLVAIIAIAGFADDAGACYVSSENGTVSLIQDQIYETVSCTLIGKDLYVATVKDTRGRRWSFYVGKALPSVFVVRAGEERYVPFGKDFASVAVAANTQGSP
jgi:hypothetical protein